MSQEILLEVNNISKSFHGLAGAKQLVLGGISFKLNVTESYGNINSILAPANSGKTILLKIISAIEKPSEGEILLLGRKYEKPTGEITLIPEKPSSFPWMNVRQNIEFALNLKNNDPSNLKNIDEIISSVGLTGYEDHFPHEKSLGFRFRISIARALAIKPRIILLDEPLKNLHGETRKEIFSLINNLTKELNLNIIIATANISDAISISNKIFLMTPYPGKIAKEFDIDRSKDLHEHSDYFISIKHSVEKSFNGN